MNLNFQSKNEAGQGFTLLEVLISIVLLVVISLGIYQATTETYRLRDILMHEGDFYNSIRLSMGILERDIAMLYSPTLAAPPQKDNPTPAETKEMEDVLATDAGQSTPFWSPAIDKTGIRPSHFVGTETKLTFISLSHIRVYKDSPESEFAKITYELQAEKDNSDAPELRGTSLLVKNESTRAFDEDESKDLNPTVYPLLHGITKLKYRYYNKAKDQWLNSWDSDKEEFKNIYPDRIEITVEVKGPSRLQFEGIYHFRPEIPLHGLDPST